jgi:hypothetical protein
MWWAEKRKKKLTARLIEQLCNALQKPVFLRHRPENAEGKL